MGNPAQVLMEVLHTYDRHWHELAARFGLGQKETLKVTSTSEHKNWVLDQQPVGCV